MESYFEFLSRINTFETPELYLGEGDFKANIKLTDKMENKRFKKFYGDTAVFLLDNKINAKLANIQRALYVSFPQCFAEMLLPETFHMTLHDLISSQDINLIKADLVSNEERAMPLLKAISEQNETIEMRSHYLFNMVNTSLVLGAIPQNEREYDKLMTLYNLFDGIKPLPYPLTPHITIAYFSDDGFLKADLKKLCAAVKQFNEESFRFTLLTEQLVYQRFTSMNEYLTIR